MPDKFGQPDAPEEVQDTQTQEQKEAATPKKSAPAGANPYAYDLADFIDQPREGASTGARQTLEANEFNDETLLQDAGYGPDGTAPVEEVEAEEVTEQIEISDEWLEIFAGVGVEITDEAMPRLIQYLQAADDYERFKLNLTRREKLKAAWIAFLRKVLPAWDEKQGLLAMIVLLYIEHLVVGFWMLGWRIINGTFEWPDVWPFSRFRKKKTEEVEPEPAPAPSPAPQPQPRGPQVGDALAEQPEPQQTIQLLKPAPTEPAPTPKVEKPAAEPAPQADEITEAPTVYVAPTSAKMPGNQKQDPMDGRLFEAGTGQPQTAWEKTHTETGAIYRIAPDTFAVNATFQKWLHSKGFYKNRPRTGRYSKKQ